MEMERRQLLKSSGVLAAGGLLTAAMSTAAEATDSVKPSGKVPVGPYTNPGGPRNRVIISNDLSGDPDGLFALVHALLCSTSQVAGIVGSLSGIQRNPKAADGSKQKADTVLSLMHLKGRIPTFAGSNQPLVNLTTPQVTAGAKAIVAEANRTDTKLPLFVAVGGTLTDFASALLLDPSIASKCTLVWIGGGNYPSGGQEYNFDQDPIAAQVVFNHTEVPIWQVNQHAYVQCLVSDAELQLNVRPYGKIGAWLYEQLYATIVDLSSFLNMGEAYVLGDSPLVLLTALNGAYDGTGEGGTGTSEFTSIFAPRLNADGTYTTRGTGRKIRVYTSIDTRILYNDLFAKLRLHYGGR